MPDELELLRLTAAVVVAHAENHSLAPESVAALVYAVHGALKTAGTPIVVAPDAPVPAVPVKKSVFPDYIVCLEDGKKLKMLKRHLKTAYNMTPDQYRDRWSLPRDYPMVAPDYSEKRSSLAKEAGLGQVRQASAPTLVLTDPDKPAKRAAGRPRKAA